MVFEYIINDYKLDLVDGRRDSSYMLQGAEHRAYCDACTLIAEYNDGFYG